MSYGVVGRNTPAGLDMEIRRCFSSPAEEVDPTYSLISPREVDEPITEFFLKNRKERYIAVYAGGRIAAKHIELLEARLPVFSAMSTEDLLLMNVPEGTRTVSSMLTGVARRPEYATPMFEGIGKLLGKMYEVGMGVPAMPVLDQLAIVADPTQSHGVKVYVAPPYLFDNDVDQPDVFDGLSLELSLARGLEVAAVENLIDSTREGWNAHN